MGGVNGTKYTVCAGNEAWTWQNAKTGQKCSGIDRYTGVRGDCEVMSPRKPYPLCHSVCRFDVLDVGGDCNNPNS
jgi:hypothetical protein